jgi:hypothetical protein
MKVVKVDNDVKEVRVAFADEKQEKQQQHQTKLTEVGGFSFAWEGGWWFGSRNC